MPVWDIFSHNACQIKGMVVKDHPLALWSSDYFTSRLENETLP